MSSLLFNIWRNKTILNVTVWPPEYIIFMYPHSYQVDTLPAYNRDLAKAKNLRQKNSVTDFTPCYWERRYLESNLKWIDTGSNLDYWLDYDVNDEIDRKDSSPNQKSLEVIEDHGLDNWVSDDEESLQMYKVHPPPESWSNRVNTESDKDEFPCSNHLSHSSSSTSNHKSPSDITITADSPTVDNPAPVPNLV